MKLRFALPQRTVPGQDRQLPICPIAPRVRICCLHGAVPSFIQRCAVDRARARESTFAKRNWMCPCAALEPLVSRQNPGLLRIAKLPVPQTAVTDTERPAVTNHKKEKKSKTQNKNISQPHPPACTQCKDIDGVASFCIVCSDLQCAGRTKNPSIHVPPHCWVLGGRI